MEEASLAWLSRKHEHEHSSRAEESSDGHARGLAGMGAAGAGAAGIGCQLSIQCMARIYVEH